MEPRVNEDIRSHEVLLIDKEGNKVGVVPLKEALEQAREADLDLVEISPNTKPPVCKILDYGRFRFEKEKRSRNEPAECVAKNIFLSIPNIAL